MWPLLLLIPLLFTEDKKKKCVCSVAHGDFEPTSPCFKECSSQMPLPAEQPCDWVEAWTEIGGAEEVPPVVIEAYRALAANPLASSGDWYYLAQLAEMYGAYQAADCFRSTGDAREQMGL